MGGFGEPSLPVGLCGISARVAPSLFCLILRSKMF